MSISAADGNIGDVFIRRECLAMLRERYPSSQMRVYAGSMSDDYVASVVGCTSDVETFTRSGEFARKLLGSVVTTRGSVLVVAPGPAFLGRSVGRRIKHLMLGVFASLTRVRGCTVLVLGRSVIGGNRWDVWVENILRRAASQYGTRDLRTMTRLAGSVALVPDMAFRGSELSPSRGGGDTLVVSVRGDRPLPEWFVPAVEAIASKHVLRIVCVTQVKSDDRANAALASRLGATHIAWAPGVTHRDQEAAVSDVYSRSAVCVTDRLHVGILAARAGAVPVVYSSAGDTKLADSLSWVVPSASLAVSGRTKLEGFVSEAGRLGQSEAVNAAARLIDRFSQEVGESMQEDDSFHEPMPELTERETAS
ncbi:polysaccharide pyruvyl transferase family protein [Gordonia insulae]|uniref:polysaccharide pyruvyl transferase family protein n=1 Tax=Gordonia insulae TaxID=2420509 RepID=UPI0013DDD07B|nr:polysaccharide pyruvyl transferase family protein [Gordonia insulae]